MTAPQSTPDVLTLLQYLDGELEPSEARRIEQQATSDQEVREQIDRLRHFLTEMGTTVDEMSFSASHPPAVSLDCPDLEVVIAYAADALDGTEKPQFEQHLRHCEACLHDVVQHRTVATWAAIGDDVPLPADLKARTEALWTPMKPTVTRLVIQQLKKGVAKGLTLLEKHIVEPIVSVLEMPTPQLALRGGESASPGETPVLVFRVDAGKPIIEGTLMLPPGGEATLTLKFLGADQQPLVKKLVELRQHDKLIFSKETDARGVLDASDIDLNPGVYEVECPAIQTKFELDLRGPEA